MITQKNIHGIFGAPVSNIGKNILSDVANTTAHPKRVFVSEQNLHIIHKKFALLMSKPVEYRFLFIFPVLTALIQKTLHSGYPTYSTSN
jgi:hypothetical protein